MSAYLVSANHINVIVSYFVDPRPHQGLWCKINGEYEYLNKENAKDLAYMLWKENVKSVNSRYQETNSDELFEFVYLPFAKDMYSVAEIAMALDGLEYQSCEHNDYRKSEAWSNMGYMRKHLLRDIAEREDVNTWHIDTLKTRKVTA